MGGQIDYSAIPLITEILGITDIEQWLRQLLLIRQFKTPEAKND